MALEILPGRNGSPLRPMEIRWSANRREPTLTVGKDFVALCPHGTRFDWVVDRDERLLFILPRPTGSYAIQSTGAATGRVSGWPVQTFIGPGYKATLKPCTIDGKQAYVCSKRYGNPANDAGRQSTTDAEGYSATPDGQGDEQ